MKFVQFLSVSIFLGTVSLLLAGGFNIPKKEDVPKYLKQLQSSTSATDRAKAAEMLGKRGGINSKDVEGAVEPLKTALQKDKDAGVRAASARALGDIRADPEGTVPVLIERVKADSEVMNVKMAAVIALGQYGPDAKDAVQPLRDLMKKAGDPKKSKDAQTITASIQLITGMKKKKG